MKQVITRAVLAISAVGFVPGIAECVAFTVDPPGGGVQSTTGRRRHLEPILVWSLSPQIAGPGEVSHGGSSCDGPVMAGAGGAFPTSMNPVDLTYGHKLESAVDLSIPMVGLPFRLTREYTSKPDYTNGNGAGSNWALSVMRYLEVEVDGGTTIMRAGGTPGGGATAAWCGSSPFNMSVPNLLPGNGKQTLAKGSWTTDNAIWPVWILATPGQSQVYYYREPGLLEEVIIDQPELDESLYGAIAMVRDEYGNRHVYEYGDIEIKEDEFLPSVTRIKCYTVADQLQAVIDFTYETDLESATVGFLTEVEVSRPRGEGSVVTHRVFYTYHDGEETTTGTHEMGNATEWLGKAGDLIQVRIDERVDPEAGSVSPEAPVWRTRITQYRYHATDSRETADEDGDGYEHEYGAAQQLKMVINPEQIEYYAQLRSVGTSSAAGTDVVAYAAHLLTLEDGQADSSAGGLKPVNLASKIISYHDTGEVHMQYLLAGCGCGMAGTQGMQEEFEYFVYGNLSPDFRTTKITESRWVGGGTPWEPYRIRLVDLEPIPVGAGPCAGPGEPAWYTINDVLMAGDQSGPFEDMYWVTHNEYTNTGSVLVSRVYTPSAMDSYTPYGLAVGLESDDPPEYEAKTNAGLVYAYAYDEHFQRTEVRVHEGDAGTDVADYELITKTTYGSDEREFLPVKVERVRVAGDTGAITDTESDIETTTYAYGFHSETMRSIAWVKTTVEGELPSENGPTPAVVESVEIPTAYSSWEMYDTRGLNTWSIAADGSRTKRIFDNDASSPTSVSFTGSVIAVVQNADATNDGFPSTGELPSGLPEDRNTESTAGEQSLTTTYMRDVLGRVQKVVGPGGNTRITTREMRLNDERPGLMYYSEVHLPHSISSTVFDGPAMITWFNAGDRAFEKQGLKPTASYSVPGTVEDYRQVVDGYTLDTVDLLARSYMVQHVSGLNEEVRQWFNPSSSTAYYKTMYEYDELGRVAVVIGPTDEAGTAGTKTQTTYDFKNRVKTTSVSAIGSVTWSEVERRYYDSATTTEGVGNGNLTYVKQIIDGSTNDRATTFIYDYRDRRVGTLNPLAPHQAVAYDNLGRVVQSATLSGSTAATTFTSTDADRVAYQRTFYSQRGLPFRYETAIDPTVASGSATYLASNSWFDAAGRTVGQWSPSGPMTKMTYDGLGRSTAVYLTDRGGDSNPQVGSYTGYADVHASHEAVLTGDHVIEQTETRYITASNSGKGKPDLVTVRRRAADDTTSTDTLASITSAVDSYSGYYYDAAGRSSHSVNYGTNRAAFESGGSAPPITQGSPPSSDAATLVTTTSYDARGQVGSVIDPAGAVTKYFYDGLGRQYGTIENASTNATLVWNGTSGQWQGDDFSGTPGTDRAISTVFNARGDTVKYIAHVGDTGTGDQVTLYTYGVSTPASDLVTDSLLLSVVYPGDGSAGDRTVLYAYNRQGEMKSMEDQNGTVHAYTRDKLGRVTTDEVTTFGTNIDDAIDTIARTYDDAGRLATVQSIATGGSTVLNEVQFEYTPLGQVEKVWQHSTGPVTETAGAPTGDTRLVKYTYANSPVTASSGVANYSRLSAMDYPRNDNDAGSPATAVLEYFYDDLGDAISRVSRLKLDGACQVEYAYAGMGVFTLVDYAAIDVQLDRTIGGDGARLFKGHNDQDSGVYPGLDPFGRVVRHDWVDGDFHQVVDDPYIGPDRTQIVSLGYAYDQAGNRTQMVDQRPGSTWKHSFEYGYDGLQRLTSADRGRWSSGTLTAVKGSEEWALDLLGNWNSWNKDWDFSGGSYADTEMQDRTHNAANELLEIEWPTVSPVVEDLTYDKAGNLRSRTLQGRETVYTHDAWNRLVKVVIAEGIPEGDVLHQQFNGLNWRTWKHGDTAPPAYYTEIEEEEVLIQETPNGVLDDLHVFTYNASWQLVDDRITTTHTDLDNRRVQYVWGIRYIDDCVLHRVDVNNDGDYIDTDGDVDEGVHHHITDAMFSTVALMKGGTVVERVTYDAYGRPTRHAGSDLNGDGVTTTADTAVVTVSGTYNSKLGGANTYNGVADLDRDGDVDSMDLTAQLVLFSRDTYPAALSGRDNVVGFDGYIYDQETAMYTVRHRTYDPMLGRWIERDPWIYVDGPNQYLAMANAPQFIIDPLGTDTHIVDIESGHIEIYVDVYDVNGRVVGCLKVGFYAKNWSDSIWKIWEYAWTDSIIRWSYNVGPCNPSGTHIRSFPAGPEKDGRLVDWILGTMSKDGKFLQDLISEGTFQGGTVSGEGYGGYDFILQNCADYGKDCIDVHHGEAWCNPVPPIIYPRDLIYKIDERFGRQWKRVREFSPSQWDHEYTAEAQQR